MRISNECSTYINVSDVLGGYLLDSSCGNNIVSEGYRDFIADYELDSDEDLAGRDICHIRIDSTFTAVYLPESLVPERSLDAFGYRVFVRLLGLMDEVSLEASGVRRLRNLSGLDLRGRGTLIGIVDTGIDYTHNAFINADGTTRIVSIWDQTVQSGNAPEGLYFGTEFTRDQINLALASDDPGSIVPSFDEIGHGTFLAGIAAGNEEPANDFAGVVPEAELVVVKLKPAKNNIRDFYMIPHDAICFQENDIMLGVKYLLDTAEKYNRPISICIGLGTSQGSHDATGALSSYLSSLGQMSGVVVTIAAGNEGNSRHHAESIMLPGIDQETIELNVGPNEGGLYFEMWGDVPNTFGVELTSPGGEIVPTITPRINERREINFIFEQTRINIYFQLVGSRSGAQLVIVRILNPTEGIWRITLRKVDRTLRLRVNIWLPISDFIGDDTFFISSTPYITLTSPANVFIPIVATAYDVINDSLYINASRGFTRVDNTSPHLTAPGVNIIGPTPGNDYTTMSGTSIAAAHTAGLAAMLLEWGIVRGTLNNLSGVDVKNLLVRGAIRDTSRTYPSRDWGYGIVNIFGVFEVLRGNV